MDKKAAIKELNYYLTRSLMYAHKPVTGRIELPLSEVLYEKIKDFNSRNYRTSPRLIIKYIRSGSMPELV